MESDTEQAQKRAERFSIEHYGANATITTFDRQPHELINTTKDRAGNLQVDTYTWVAQVEIPPDEYAVVVAMRDRQGWHEAETERGKVKKQDAD